MCLLSTAIRGGGTVLQQIRSVYQLFTILSSHWSSSLSRGWPHASSPPPSEAGEQYYSRSGQYITCLPYSLLIGLAVSHVGGLVHLLHRHQRRRTVLQQIRSVHQIFTTLFSHWSSSLSLEWPHASSPLPSEAWESYYSKSGQYISCLPNSLLIGLAVYHVGGLMPPLHRHQRRRTVLQQIRSEHQQFTIFSSHWSSSLSRRWPRASSPLPSEAGEPYYSRSCQYLSCFVYSLLIGLAV